MVQTLLALVKAPLAEPYTGPAILSGRSSAVFFHEILATRIEVSGRKMKTSPDVKKKVNQSCCQIFFLSIPIPL